MALQVVILAAGRGKRMHSSLPKVLHLLAGKPLLEHVIDTAAAVSSTPPIIIYGHQGETLQKNLAHKNPRWVLQTDQLGTGHAVMQALPDIQEQDQVLILCGDVPLISTVTLKNLIETTPSNSVGMITAKLQNPFGYGRIKRDHQGHIIGIVEEKDATQEERAIREINTGIYFVSAKHLKQWLPSLKNQNTQQEYYLTDIIPLALHDHIAIHAVHPSRTDEIMGVNDRVQLAYLERSYQLFAAEKLMRQGVTLRDPARLDIRGEIEIGRDVTIDVNVIFEGNVVIGDQCTIGPNTILRNTTLGDHVDVRANSVLDGATVADHCTIGPFARLRPEARLAESVHIGNFCEIKKSFIGQGSKVNHLTYIGDAEIGREVNVGAGTITCNYDGVNKHKTIIGDHVFIGSCTQLVAPVIVGEGATIGAGSTITRDAPPNQLTLSRSPQLSVATWQRPKKD